MNLYGFHLIPKSVHKSKFNPTREEIDKAIAEFDAKGGVVENLPDDLLGVNPPRMVFLNKRTAMLRSVLTLPVE